jgi:bacterioferritin
MKADPPTIRHLNTVLKLALAAINQYFLHARMLGNWGFERLEADESGASIRSMKQADRLIERILFLEGLPNLQDLGKLLVGEDVAEIIENDLALETDYHAAIKGAIAHCEQAADYVTRHHLEELQEQSEARIDWLETQLVLIKSVGLPNYLESAM